MEEDEAGSWPRAVGERRLTGERSLAQLPDTTVDIYEIASSGGRDGRIDVLPAVADALRASRSLAAEVSVVDGALVYGAAVAVTRETAEAVERLVATFEAAERLPAAYAMIQYLVAQACQCIDDVVLSASTSASASARCGAAMQAAVLADLAPDAQPADLEQLAQHLAETTPAANTLQLRYDPATRVLAATTRDAAATAPQVEMTLQADAYQPRFARIVAVVFLYCASSMAAAAAAGAATAHPLLTTATTSNLLAPFLKPAQVPAEAEHVERPEPPQQAKAVRITLLLPNGPTVDFHPTTTLVTLVPAPPIGIMSVIPATCKTVVSLIPISPATTRRRRSRRSKPTPPAQAARPEDTQDGLVSTVYPAAPAPAPAPALGAPERAELVSTVHPAPAPVPIARFVKLREPTVTPITKTFTLGRDTVDKSGKRMSVVMSKVDLKRGGPGLAARGMMAISGIPTSPPPPRLKSAASVPPSDTTAMQVLLPDNVAWSTVTDVQFDAFDTYVAIVVSSPAKNGAVRCNVARLDYKDMKEYAAFKKRLKWRSAECPAAG
jgi:YD repeat-containing protein